MYGLRFWTGILLHPSARAQGGTSNSAPEFDPAAVWQQTRQLQAAKDVRTLIWDWNLASFAALAYGSSQNLRGRIKFSTRIRPSGLLAANTTAAGGKGRMDSNLGLESRLVAVPASGNRQNPRRHIKFCARIRPSDRPTANKTAAGGKGCTDSDLGLESRFVHSAGVDSCSDMCPAARTRGSASNSVPESDPAAIWQQTRQLQAAKDIQTLIWDRNLALSQHRHQLQRSFLSHSRVKRQSNQLKRGS